MRMTEMQNHDARMASFRHVLKDSHPIDLTLILTALQRSGGEMYGM